MKPTSQQEAERAWRHKEAIRTAVCGGLSFVLTVGILTFGNEHLTAWMTWVHVRDEKPQSVFTVEPPPAPTPAQPRAQQIVVRTNRNTTIPKPAQPVIRVKKPGRIVVPAVRKPVVPAEDTRQLPASLTKEHAAPESPAAPQESFPAFVRAVHPVGRVPNWGNMHSAAEWDRSYNEMQANDFVAIPRYDLSKLTIPVKELLQDRENNISTLTMKLYYSTRFFGSYNLDAGEYSGMHAGVDLKLPLGTPIGSIGGGRVLTVRQDSTLGLHVIVEHRIPGEGTFYSIYGHMGQTAVQEGQDVTPGTVLGYVGMTGKSTAPHVHLQVDRGQPGGHTRFSPERTMSHAEAEKFTVNPIRFIAQHNALPPTNIVESQTKTASSQ
jgi:murein DD-endopeptidase MepM/ murein hydrolase activator NlpD